jgi:hypothetical protein
MKLLHFSFVSFFCALTFSSSILAQQTVGVFLNTAKAYDGYTLIAPLQDSTTYLIDNCGRIVHAWQSPHTPALSAYLLKDGNLLRPIMVPTAVFKNQGGGRVERVDWDGNVLWEYTYSNDKHHQHHDIALMPNGNVLLLAFEFKSKEEAIASGRDSVTAMNGMWAEHIVEVKPIGKDSGVIVWEWHVWDHLIQNHDGTKSNYGNPSDHPELFDPNYPPNASQDWLHANGIDYNAELDQIIMSSRVLSEFYIIDHGTTLAEAASHGGGKRGRGGDILYRWGNPMAYGRGTETDRQLFFQHNAHWIPEGLNGAGHILVYNNGTGRPGGNFSSIEEIELPADMNGNYADPGAGAFLPKAPVWRYFPDSASGGFYSPFISGAQRLPNGNTLICAGIPGKIFEIDSAGNKMWEYINPVGSKGKTVQGNPPAMPFIFRAYRYGPDYPAFNGKALVPDGYIELEPGNYNCTIFKDTSSSINVLERQSEINIYPNPFSSFFTVSCYMNGSSDFQISDCLGRTILSGKLENGLNKINAKSLRPGIYICRISDKSGREVKGLRLLKL